MNRKLLEQYDIPTSNLYTPSHHHTQEKTANQLMQELEQNAKDTAELWDRILVALKPIL